MLDVLKSHYKNLSKFTIVGIVNTLIDFSVFYILHDIYDVNFVTAHVCAFFIALVNSFIFNALWTFKNLKRDKLVRQVFIFVTIGLIGLALSTCCIYMVSLYIGVYPAKILAMLVSFAWNYTGSWLFVFKD